MLKVVKQYLKYILAINLLHESVDLKAIAQRTPGFSGADLENLLNEAALVAARRVKRKLIC